MDELLVIIVVLVSYWLTVKLAQWDDAKTIDK